MRSTKWLRATRIHDAAVAAAITGALWERDEADNR
jgi:hypothetical protein